MDIIFIILTSFGILFFIRKWILELKIAKKSVINPHLKRFVSLVETLEWEIAGDKFKFDNLDHEKKVKSYLRTDIPEGMFEVISDLIAAEFKKQGYEKIPLSPSRVSSSLSISSQREVRAVKDEKLAKVKESAYKNNHWRPVNPNSIK